MIRFALAVLALVAGAAAGAREPAGLHATLSELSRQGKFSGAVVVRGPQGIRFARGYGQADPFTGELFTPDTPVDSASLAKPVTAAAILSLARNGKLDLDVSVRRYLPEYPNAETTTRHLLSHSAGLADATVGQIAGKTNAQLLAEFAKPGANPLFAPGSGFAYCNFCYTTLALLIERVGGRPYLDVVRELVRLPSGVTIRPRRLAQWTGRAIGYRSTANKIERADSDEDEVFYGAANFSISAAQLAQWGEQWSTGSLAGIRNQATTTARIAGKPSGLTTGNWYCAPRGRRCHYIGHHQGFHHMLYWDTGRRITIAMVSNNTLAPAVQQRLQRALVAFAEGKMASAKRELAAEIPARAATVGAYHFVTGERVEIAAGDGPLLIVERRGIRYAAYPIGPGIRYVPGLDVYLAAASDRSLHWLSLYDDLIAAKTN